MWPQFAHLREQFAIPRPINMQPAVFAPHYQPTAEPPPLQSDHDEPEWVRCDLPEHAAYYESP